MSQKYLGIMPYYGSPTYIYQRLGMGLSISPSLFMHFITQVLDQIEYRKHFIAIMDDVLLHSKCKDHMTHIVALLEATIKNGLKISPKKCQLFMKNVVYIENRNYNIYERQDVMLSEELRNYQLSKIYEHSVEW